MERKGRRAALDELGTRITPSRGWNDVVLREETRARLRELASQARKGEFGAKPAGRRGITALFSGPSGIGQTAAAGILAGQLGLDLFRIDLAGVVSKSIGETEKNLGRVFDAAGQSGAILFFDEAGALFGKRTGVRDSHDRYANSAIDDLLQRMEAYGGLAILATRRRALDSALRRRFRYVIEFPSPPPAPGSASRSGPSRKRRAAKARSTP